MGQKDEILEKSALIFMQSGIKSVTLDDLAAQLKVSKKTFYNYFENKEDLVYHALLWYLSNDKACMEQELCKHDNPIDEIIAVSKIVIERLKVIHPSIHYDLQKYYPKAWAELEKYKKEVIAEMFMNNLQRGQQRGLYRRTFNPEIITKLYVQKIDMIFNPFLFPPSEYPFHKVYLELVLHHIYGVVSKKGYDYLERKIKKEKLVSR